MPASVNAFNALIRPGLRKDFRDEYNKYPDEWKDFLKSGTMDLPEMAATIMTGPARMYEKGDLEPIAFSQPVIGPRVGGVDKEFGLGVAIGRKIIEDDQYAKITAAAKWLANAARQTKEYRAAGFLDDAFTGSTYKGIDTLSLINASHTYLNNGATTWSNNSGAITVSMTGFTAMLDTFGTMKNHDGDPIKMMLDTVVIGNTAGDIHTAMQILNTQKEPFTADNNDNVVKQRLGNTKLVISRYKTNTRHWFGIDSAWNDAELRVRRALKLEDEMDFKTGAALNKATERYMIWFVDPRGWAGCNPS